MNLFPVRNGAVPADIRNANEGLPAQERDLPAAERSHGAILPSLLPCHAAYRAHHVNLDRLDCPQIARVATTRTATVDPPLPVGRRFLPTDTLNDGRAVQTFAVPELFRRSIIVPMTAAGSVAMIGLVERWRTSRASTMKMTSSAIFVAWSPTRSK